MKRLLFFLAFLTTSITCAQMQVHTVQVTTNDLVYDSITNRIYASIPSSNGSNGNSIGIINPNTYTLESTVFIGSEPTVLAISDDGQYIYAGFNGSSTVRRFDVTSQTSEIQFTIGSDPFHGAYYADDIEVMPGNPNSIAVSRRRQGVSPRHGGVAIFDDNVMRPTTTPDHTGSNVIEFVDSNTVVGYNNETTEFGLRELRVDANGVTNLSVNENVLSGFGLDFIYHGNKVYATNGVVVDMVSTPFVSGQFSDASGPVAYDVYNDRVCFASFEWGGEIHFKRYNPNNFLLTDSIYITQASGNTKSLITCGNGCYAFNTTDDQVIIIKYSPLGLSDFESKSEISIYPNPTVNFLNIDNVSNGSYSIVDMKGSIVLNGVVSNNPVNVSSLNEGTYFVHINSDNNVYRKRFVKM